MPYYIQIWDFWIWFVFLLPPTTPFSRMKNKSIPIFPTFKEAIE